MQYLYLYSQKNSGIIHHFDTCLWSNSLVSSDHKEIVTLLWCVHFHCTLNDVGSRNTLCSTMELPFLNPNLFLFHNLWNIFISLVKQRSEKITVRSKILTAIFMGLLVSVIHIVSVMVNSSANLFTSRGGQEVVVLNTNLLSKHAE